VGRIDSATQCRDFRHGGKTGPALKDFHDRMMMKIAERAFNAGFVFP
jgi:hypothetical protein